MSDKVKVKPHKRGDTDVRAYERMKGGAMKRPAVLDPVHAQPKEGTKIVSRDPERQGEVRPLEGVTILGKDTGPRKGVKRVSRGG